MSRRDYHRHYYATNRLRRRAQRLASKYGLSADWRSFLPIDRQWLLTTSTLERNLRQH